MFESLKYMWKQESAKINLKMSAKVDACKTKSGIAKCASCEDHRICPIRRYEK